MATDYDAPRTNETAEEDGDVTLAAAKAAGASSSSAHVIDAEPDPDNSVELPGADMSGESLDVTVVPELADEFTCTRCLLVQHRSRRASGGRGQAICRDCA